MGGLDVLDYFYPYRVYAANAIAHGRLPLWNSAIFSGAPFLANIQTALFYPFSALFYLLPEPAAYTWSILVHLFLAALFTYLFARQSLHLDPAPALVAAIVFAFGGFMSGQLGHLNQFSAAAWLPLLLLCWDKASAGRLLFVLVGALVVALQFLAGHTQESYLMLVALLGYAVFQTALDTRRIAPESGPGAGLRLVVINALVLVTLVALGAGLAAIQLLPTTELQAWSIRSAGLSLADATTFTLKAPDIFTALLPPFWNRALLLQPGGSEFAGYTGIVALVLTLVALTYRWRRRHTVFFALLALFALLVALGEQTPLFHLLFRALPAFSSFRVPARWLFLYSFSLAMLAGSGCQALLQRDGPRNWRPFAAVVAAASLLLAIAAHWQHLPSMATLLTWGIAGALGVALVAISFTLRTRIIPVAGSLALLCLELWLAGQSMDYNQPTLSRLFTEPIPTIQFLQAQPQTGRVLSLARDTYVPAIEPAFRQQWSSQLTPEQILSYLSFYKLREVMEPNTTMAASLSTLDGYDGGILPLARYVLFKNALTGVPSAADERIRFVMHWLPNRALLNLAGVRYLVMDEVDDKSAGGVRYDLSSFISVDAQHPQATLTFPIPVQTTAVNLIAGFQGPQQPAASALATVTLTSPTGETQTLPVLYGAGSSFATLSTSTGDLPTKLLTNALPAPFTVRSVTLNSNSAADTTFLNGLALVDTANGSSVSPLVAPGTALPLIYRGDVKIYRNPDALPPVFMVHQAQVAPNAEAALSYLRQPAFNPSAGAIVEPEPAPVAAPSPSLLSRAIARLRRLLPSAQPFQIPSAWLQTQPPGPGAPADSVQIQQPSPERLTATTSSSTASFLLFTQSYYPGWTATIDGQASRIIGADYLYQAVYLPAGQHTVVFRFQPRSLTLGIAISLTSTGVALLGIVLSWVGGRRRKKD